jgi:uncharacterized RDD family membrane protein YckC
VNDDGPTWPRGDEADPPPPPPPPPPSTDPGRHGAPAPTGRAAEIGPRIGARLIDAVLLWVVNAVILVPVVLGSIITDASASAAFGFASSVGGFVAQLVTTAITVGYFVFLESSRGATLGKQLLNLRVEGPHGALPTVEMALKRNAWLLLSLVPAVGGLLQIGAVIWIIVSVSGSPENRGVHDDFAGGTRVVTT